MLARPASAPVPPLAAEQAPRPRTDTILAGNPGPIDLVAGGSTALAAHEDVGVPWPRRRADGSWEAWLPARASDTAPSAAEVQEPA